MKNLRKGTLICWIIAALFLICSFSFIPNGEWVSFLGGVVIAGLLAFVGLRMQNKPISTSNRSVDPPIVTSRSHNISKDVDTNLLTSKFQHKTFKLSGVTFRNDDGTNRQTVLRKIKWHDDPFDGDVVFDLLPYEWEGKPACAVTANGIQIGNIPASESAFVVSNMDRMVCIVDFNAYGGGKDDEGKSKSIGAEIVVRYRA